MKISAIILVVLFFIMGCSEKFTPNGPYQQSLVVYSLINISADTQFVKVYSTLDPAVHSVNELKSVNEVIGATVSLLRDSTEYVFHDTVQAVEENGIIRNVHSYVHYAADIQTNKKYHLTVRSNGYPEASASVTTFPEGHIITINTQLFTNPNIGKDIECEFYFGKGSYAFLVRLLLEYERRENNAWIQEYREVPMYYLNDEPVLPHLEIVNPIGKIKKTYSIALYNETLAKIKSNRNDTIRFTSAVFEFQQFDENLYAYFSIANNFPGGSSIRLDEPDYTNVTNGFGIVGVLSKKSQRFPISVNP